MQKRTTKRAGARKTSTKATSRKAAQTTKPPRKATAKRATPKAEKTQRPRDPRLPAPGSTLIRPYKGTHFGV